MKEDNIENNDDEIVIEINSNEDIQKSGRRQTRIGNNKKSKKGSNEEKKKRKERKREGRNDKRKEGRKP